MRNVGLHTSYIKQLHPVLNFVYQNISKVAKLYIIYADPRNKDAKMVDRDLCTRRGYYSAYY